MAKPPALETDRLILRGYTAADFEPYAAMWADPAVVRYIGGTPVSREESWSRFLRAFGMWEHLGFGFFVVADKATGAFLGEAGFQERHRDIVPSMEGTMETGWGFVPTAQGRGYGFEAVTAALQWSDATFPGARYTALIDIENTASQKLARKVGFRELSPTVYHGVSAMLFER